MRISEKQARDLGITPKPPKDTKRWSKAKHSQAMFIARCKAHGLPEPIPEFKFHPSRDWRFDYLFSETVAMEIEGGLYGRCKACPMCKRRPVGAHSSIERLKSDMEKYNAAAIAGFCVIRVRPEEVTSGAAFALVRRALGLGEQP